MTSHPETVSAGNRPGPPLTPGPGGLVQVLRVSSLGAVGLWSSPLCSLLRGTARPFLLLASLSSRGARAPRGCCGRLETVSLPFPASTPSRVSERPGPRLELGLVWVPPPCSVQLTTFPSPPGQLHLSIRPSHFPFSRG